jgi:hypothetical protein
MEYIQVGSYQFRTESLKGIALKDAKENFKSIDERLVKRAWEEANPKKPSRRKSKKKDSDNE